MSSDPISPTVAKKKKKKEKEKDSTEIGWEGLYKGELVDGIRHGKGSVTFPNGDVFTGIFRAGMRDGHGTLVQSDGVRYEGQWLRSKRHGSGKEVWPNGDQYEGDFKNDLFHGRGALKSRSGWYRGSFHDGVKDGEGIMNFNSGGSYEGKWAHNRFEGTGTYLWPDNRRYEGEWRNGRHEGIGMMNWPNGQRYDGLWKEGLIHGEGVHRWQNGMCREGIWANGVRVKWVSSESYGLVGPYQKNKTMEAISKEKGRMAKKASVAHLDTARSSSTSFSMS